MLITVLHYWTSTDLPHVHQFYRVLYFLPIIISAFWFGLRGSLTTSLAITLFYLAYAIFYWRGFSASDLDRLVEIGLVESRGERKGRSWHLSAATYRRLGEEAAYIRQRGFEPIQQEQMVMQYVRKHGSISRGQAAELCRLGPQQAYRLLKRLEKSGQLRRTGGSTKGVRYGLPSK